MRLPVVSDPDTGWRLDVRRVDRSGLVTLTDAAASWGWTGAVGLCLDTGGNVLLVTRHHRRCGHAARLDSRSRLRLPLAWRRLHRAHAGARVAILTAPADGPEEEVRIELADRLAERATLPAGFP